MKLFTILIIKLNTNILVFKFLTSIEFLASASDAAFSASSRYPSLYSKEPKDTNTTSRNSFGTEVRAMWRQSIALREFPRTRQYKEARVRKSQLGPTLWNKVIYIHQPVTLWTWPLQSSGNSRQIISDLLPCWWQWESAAQSPLPSCYVPQWHT